MGDVGRGLKSGADGEIKRWQISGNSDGNYHVKMVIVMREIIKTEKMKRKRRFEMEKILNRIKREGRCCIGTLRCESFSLTAINFCDFHEAQRSQS